jgi:uncharacterized repeat protein (TIGR03803 family)
MDARGALYGTTLKGGAQNLGTVFKLKPGSTYSETILHSFGASNDGFYPYDSLALSGSVLYGTTYGGSGNAGVVFRILTTGAKYKVLHAFGITQGDYGTNPQAGVILQGTTLFGVTAAGGRLNGGGGEAFQVTL